MIYTVEVHKSKSFWTQKWYWRVLHENGNILLFSEMYRNQKDCVDVARRFARHNKLEFTQVDA